MRRTVEVPGIVGIRSGAAVVNANGVPGTLGCLALAREDGALVLVTTWHVLFGAGAKEQENVWVEGDRESGSFRRVARTLHGRCGTVRHEGSSVHVDCASAELYPQPLPGRWRASAAGTEPNLLPGDRVTKTGAATGTTEGIVETIDHAKTARVGGRRRSLCGQILVGPKDPGEVFAADGDSGAVLRSTAGDAVGLLWGIDARGFGLACPIAPVLRVLHVRLVSLESGGAP